MPGQLLVLTKSFLEEFIFSALLRAGRFSKCPMIGSRASHREISCPHYEWPLNSGGGGVGGAGARTCSPTGIIFQGFVFFIWRVLVPKSPEENPIGNEKFLSKWTEITDFLSNSCRGTQHLTRNIAWIFYTLEVTNKHGIDNFRVGKNLGDFTGYS